MDIVIDCGWTNHIIPDKSMFKTFSMLEGDGSAMFFTNEDGTHQRVHGVGDVFLPFYDRNKANYTFNLQRALYVPISKLHLISASLLVKQGNTVIFNQNPPTGVRQQKAYFIERDGLFWFKHSAEKPNMSALSIAKRHTRFSHANCETLIKLQITQLKAWLFPVHWQPISVLHVHNVRYLHLTDLKTLKSDQHENLN